MQLFLIILTNVVMWIIFYLIMTLKIEKSSSEFREKRLRKVMEEIMTEFNAAAERNITILENRISILRKLLERSGSLKTVDIKESGPASGGISPENSEIEKKEIPVRKELINKTEKKILKSGIDFKSVLITAAESLAKIRSFLNRKRITESSAGAADSHEAERIITANAGRVSDDMLKRDILSFQNNIKGISSYISEADSIEPDSSDSIDTEEEVLDEEEIYRMFKTSDDRYSLILEFFNRGFPVSDIAKYSGIPEGEVKLILNLQGN